MKRETKYAIGLDIGIASIGYAVIALDYEENPWGIIRIGSRIFDKAEDSKTGASLALPRRESRSARRRLRRHRHRLERIKNLLIKSYIITEEKLEELYTGQLSDIYSLRVDALEKKITNEELTRILIHLAQRRGFKSNRKSEVSDKEAGKLLIAVNENQKRIQEKGYRTVGEMLLKDELFQDHKRNKSGDYLTTVHRDMIADEANKILAKQQELGNQYITDEFTKNYIEILLSQRQFDEGPGTPSRYSGNQILNMIGKCTFEKSEIRAAKACYSFEYFNLLQKVNHLGLVVKGTTIRLDEEQRKKVVTLAFKKADLKYYHIRKELGISDEVCFNSITYKDDDFESLEKKTKFNFLPAYHQFRKALDKITKNHIDTLPKDTLDDIGNILSIYKGDAKRTEELTKLNLSNEEIEHLLSIGSLSKFCHLSLKVLRKLIPYLEQGMIYNEACLAAGYNFKAHDNNEKTFLLPAKKDEMENITSPVARRAIAQAIKVINAIIREQGYSPTFINIELAREMAKDFDERTKLKKSMDENQAYNERIKQRLIDEFKISNPSGLDIVKFKLWLEQDGLSPYSQKPIEANRLSETGYAEIDHIVPYSISFDDTMNNKVLVFKHENQHKGNRLPLQYLAEKFGRQEANKFTVWVQNNIRKYRKKQNLLKPKITDDDRNRFKERNLTDTKTISRFLYNYINDYLQFSPSDVGRKKKVTAVNGAVTSYLRKRWGITKIRENGDIHHAVDALVIACTTDKIIQELSAYSSYKEMQYVQTDKESIVVDPLRGEVVDRFPMPWEDFRQELTARLSDNPVAALRKLNLIFYSTMDLNKIKPIFVSRMPRHKVTGPAHKETVKSPRHINEGLLLQKLDLTSLKLNKDGEIENYYAPESDIHLYEALKKRLLKFGNDGKKAFEEPFYKPTANGKKAPLVKKVKVYEKSTLSVPVQQKSGAADNDSMVRIDVFKVENSGYYLVPIYVADTLKSKLPNKAVAAYKKYDEWPEMNDDNFVFSLYPNDLIKITHKKELKLSIVNKNSSLPSVLVAKEQFAYYKSMNISTGAINIITHDNSYKADSLGVKTLLNLEKYQVDVLGNYTKVKEETRQPFTKKRK